MTAPESTNTGVATRQQLAAAVKAAPAGELSPEARAIIAERRAINDMATAIAGATWNKAGISGDAARAVAEWCRREDVDPVSELDVLGAKLYKNAAWHIRKGAELRSLGLVRDVEVIHVAHDDRLAAIVKEGGADAEWATAEASRRRRLRIEHGIPDKAAGAVVVRVYLPGVATPIEGANWCGNGVRRNDPVGDAEPTKTAETRALRRAWRQLMEKTPELAARVLPRARGASLQPESHEGGVEIEHLITSGRQLARRQEAEHQRALPPKGHAMTWQSVPGGDLYAETEADVPPVGDGSVITATGEDPYEGDELPLDDARPAQARPNAVAEGR